MVDGSGDGTADDWGGWPERVAALGAVVLTHDKPGCGGSPGDWTTQTLEDRAHEALSAAAVLRRRAEVAGPVGLLGVSQGGWVSLSAAKLAPDQVGFIVSLSGPGVSPARQDRVRIARDLRAEGRAEAETAEALAWLDERARLLTDGRPVAEVLELQNSLSDRPWYATTTRYFDTEAGLGFLARIIDFDAEAILPHVRCPVLALFGAADPLVPVAEGVAAFATGLPENPANGLAVFPDADHGLFIAPPTPGTDRTAQLAPGFLTLLRGFLAARKSG
ncbi:CocE/NonD family hydrolase [Stackebrandtia albiflava]